MSVRVCIAICTWNRARLLEGLLHHLAALEVPDGAGVNVIVVNNGCTDDTDAVVHAMSGRLDLNLLHEPEPGLSHARNRAVAHAHGDYIIWIDDDVLVQPDWLGAYVRAFRARPDISFFGGPIVPRFTAPPPSWLSRGWPEVSVHYALRTCTAAERVTGEYTPFGANLALRTDVQRRYAYDPALGRRAATPTGGEECAVLARIMEAGGVGWWVPDAPVEHLVTPERMTTHYLRSILVQEGMVEAGSVDDTGAWLTGWLLRKRAVQSELAYRLHRLVSPPEVWLRHFKRAGIAEGLLRAHRT